jgi:hypothetical protein
VDDEELAALALAADPDAPVPDDAVSIFELDPERGEAVLPDWYMPPASGSVRPGWRRRVAVGLISTFLLINAAGLCSTYGHIVVS